MQASALPEGVEAPILVREAAPLEAVIAPGAKVLLKARPGMGLFSLVAIGCVAAKDFRDGPG
jgi:hypothetical protein